MIDGGAFALTLGTSVQLDPPDTHVDEVLLSNLSGFTCSVNNGGGDIQTLTPWTVNTFPIFPGSSLSLRPLSSISGASPSDVTLRVSWAVDSEVVNGSYPQTLTSQAIAAAIAGTVTAAIAGTVNTGSVPYVIKPFSFLPIPGTTSIAVPPGTNALGFHAIGFTTAAVRGTLVQIIGHQTGTVYYAGSPLANQGSAGWTGYRICPFSSAVDSSVDVVTTVSGGPAGQFSYALTGYGLTVPPLNLITPPGNYTTVQANGGTLPITVLPDARASLNCLYQIHSLTMYAAGTTGNPQLSAFRSDGTWQPLLATGGGSATVSYPAPLKNVLALRLDINGSSYINGAVTWGYQE